MESKLKVLLVICRSKRFLLKFVKPLEEAMTKLGIDISVDEEPSKTQQRRNRQLEEEQSSDSEIENSES